MIGGGGREHALAWKLAQSTEVETVFVAPGNAGTAVEPKLENITVDTSDYPALAEFAKANDCELTVVGPEAPLVNGIVDFFESQGLHCFGPRAAAAQLEDPKHSPKNFSPDMPFQPGLMRRLLTLTRRVPTFRHKGRPSL